MEQTVGKPTNDERYKRIYDQLVFDDAINLGCDWLEAGSGEPLTPLQYSSLYKSGFVSHPVTEILEIFNDWGDYIALTKTFYDDRLIEKVAREEQLLTSLCAERDQNLVPSVLFRDTVRRQVHSPDSKRPLLRFDLAEDEAPVAVILNRYYRYVLVNHILDEWPGQEVGEDRKINIAMGFNATTATGGAPLSSLYGCLKNSRGSLTQEAVETAAERLGIYDYVFPESRQAHLKALVKAAGTSSTLEYSYNFPVELSLYEPEEVYYNLAKHQLVLGKTAVGAVKDEILPLPQLLTSEIPVNQRADWHRFMEWQKDDCLRYGQWLMKLLEKTNSTLTTEIIERAARLRLGLGYSGIEVRCGSLPEYYIALGRETKNQPGDFDHLSYEDVLDHIRTVASKNDGKVNEFILRQHYQQNRRAGLRTLSPAVIRTLSGKPLGTVIQEAGFQRRLKTSPEECVAKAVDYYQRTGQLPRALDLHGQNGLHTWPTIYRYFGSLGSFHESITQALAAPADYSEEVA